MEKAKGKRWLAVSPLATEWQRVPDEEGAPEFEIGFWPPAIAEKLEVLLSAVLKRTKGDTSPVSEATIAEETRSSAVGLEFQRLAVKFGVRGWKSGDDEIKAKTETVTLDGREYPALSDESLDALYHTKVDVPDDKGELVQIRLLAALSIKARFFNVLSEDLKKTLASRRNSSAATSSGTSAPSATSESLKASP